MTYDEWVTEYHPIKNYYEESYDSFMFETYGDDWQFINAIPKDRVWTVIEGDEGGEVIVEGQRFVNRLGYFVTVRAWTEPTEVQL